MPTATATATEAPAGPLDGMLSLTAAQSEFTVGDVISLNFTFTNEYGGWGDKITESTYSATPFADLYGGAVVECTIDTGTGYRFTPGIEVSYGSVLSCTYLYTATAADAEAGEIDAQVALDVPYVGSTVSNVVVITAAE